MPNTISSKIAALGLLWCAALPAQTAIRVRADNDAFNFWQPPYDRPDEEYSSGVRLSLDYDGPTAWMKRFGERAHVSCDAKADKCVQLHTRTLGQDIYTAARHIDDPLPEPGSRPDAGVLWVQEAERDARPFRLDETSITLGVTGEPSLAQPMQQFFHGLSPGFQRPVDWSRQLPFEPVFGIGYDRHVLSDYNGVQLQPHFGGAVGSLLTEVRGGVGARGGWNLLHPWMPSPLPTSAEVAFFGDASLRGVLRDETLTGSVLRRSERVAVKPFVLESQVGFSVRYWRGTFAYVVHSTGPEYTTRSGSHLWSTLQIEWHPRQ